MTSHLSRRRLALAMVSAALLAGCQDVPSAITLPPDRAPSFDLSDGANRGNPHFFFLPPMVPAPRYTGTFDASPSPIVEICRGTASTCAASDVVARFTKTTGPGSETIRADAAGQQYIVNWNTDQFALSYSVTYRVRVLVEKTVLGYADVRLYSTGSAAKNTTTGTDIALVNGRTLPIKFRIETGAVYVVQPPAPGQTATIATIDGAVKISVPSGSISEPVAITADQVTLPVTVPTNEVIAETTYDFGPTGTQFVAPVEVSVRYDPAKLPANRKEESLRLATLVNGRWEWVKGSHVDPATNTVSGELQHFSTYAVMPARRIAFTVNLNLPPAEYPPYDRINEIHMIYETGEYIGRLVTGATDPAWSHDGSRIAFIDDSYWERGDHHLRLIGPDGTGTIVLPGVTGGTGDQSERLVWTSDDKRIFYSSAWNATGTGYLCSTSTNPIGTVSCNTVPWQGFHSLSPDGSTIAFLQSGPEPEPFSGGVFLMSVTGSGAHEIMHVSGGYDWWGTAWSSDGKGIFFTTNTSLADGPQDIRRLEIATGAVTTVASGIYASYDTGFWPLTSWASRWLTPGTIPGRAQLTFLAYVSGSWGYWTINEDGSGLRLVYSEDQLRAAIGSTTAPRLVNHESWEP
jgi:hypothetical protein